MSEQEALKTEGRIEALELIVAALTRSLREVIGRVEKLEREPRPVAEYRWYSGPAR